MHLGRSRTKRGTVDWKGAALLLFFKRRKLFGAPPCRVKEPNDSLSSYCPAAGQWNLRLASSFGSKERVDTDWKKLLAGWLFILTVWPFIFLVVYFFCTNDGAA